MNKVLLITGTIAAFLWVLVTLMTFGFPMPWCQTLDAVTFHHLSGPITSLANGFYYDVPNNQMPTVWFLFLFFIIFVLVFWAALRVEKTSAQKNTLAIVILFSILFRLILLPGELIHENDIYRYLWDGKVFAHGINPFKYAPVDLRVHEEGSAMDRDDTPGDTTTGARTFSAQDKKELETLIALRDRNPVFFNRIGHQQVPTIYPPVAQLVFVLSSLVRPDSILFLKFIFILFDIAGIGLIVAILRHLGRSPALALVYGWSPLILKEYANSGHYDPVGIFFMLLALYLYMKRKGMAFATALMLSALTKFFTLVLFPVFARCLSWRNVLSVAGAVALLYLPFMVLGHTGWGVWTGFLVYNQHWSYNASVFELLYAILERFAPVMTTSLVWAKLMIAAIFLFVMAGIMRSQNSDDRSIAHKCFLALAALFILNPVGDPWYFGWVMPFLCIFPYRAWMLLSGLLAFSYVNFQPGILPGEFLHIPVVNWIIYAPFLGYWAFETFYQRRKFI